MTDGKEKRQHCCISHEFLRAAKKHPSKVAVIHATGPRKTITYPPFYEGDRCFTFADVLASVDSLTSRLRSILDGSDDPHLIRPRHLGSKSTSSTSNEEHPKIVGLYMPPSVEYVVSVLSVLRCGEAFLPLDNSWPEERISSIISSSNVELIIALDRSHWLVASGLCAVLCFSMEERVEEFTGISDFVWHCEMKRQRSFCYLMYTSGSTGKPKGVCGTEQGLLNRFLWMQDLYPLDGEEFLFFKTSISFIDHLQEFLSAILTGCTLVIPPASELKKNLTLIIDFLRAYSISRLTTVPSMIRAILPALQSQKNLIPCSLKLLILSGEVLFLSLWHMLSMLLPKVSILNIYGSTEVSGDCLFFDCKRLPMILETETLTSVPIGVPISNCNVVLVESDNATPNQGEIYVGGLCLSGGYFSASTSVSSDFVNLHQNSICNCSVKCGGLWYFRTGDFAQRLQSGDLVFLGRKDRTIKVNGQRIALEEIEYTIREYPGILDAAVVSRKVQGELSLLEAFISSQDKEKSSEELIKSIKSWMMKKLPLAMIPNHFVLMDSLPMSASGKVDYVSLTGSTFSTICAQDAIGKTKTSDLLQTIKKAFGEALVVEEVSDDDNFFMMGGNSIAAAHAAFNLGINIRMIYNFPTPFELQIALLESMGSFNVEVGADANWKLNQEADKGNMFDSVYSSNGNQLFRNHYGEDENHAVASKRPKVDSDRIFAPKVVGQRGGSMWKLASPPVPFSFSRCNKVMHEEGYMGNYTLPVMLSDKVPLNRLGCIQELWKVHMESCVDASPVVVLIDSDVYLLIGSHSHKFFCVNAKSGSILWQIKLEGRVECSAAIVGDFSQVVVGCYKGNLYFIDLSNGNICWTFQTFGEVKCQPVVDVSRQLIWCGSHDHNLYALDYRNHCCVYKLSCGGSIFGSPAIDEVHGTLYAASTSGRVTAISVKASRFHTLWLCELAVPIFGSLSITSPNRYVICCLVDGHVVAMDSSGCIMWKCRTGGPIFAGACTSFALPSQVLVCSRNGSICSFESEKGDLLWEYNVGDPITASAYVDENLQLISETSLPADRLICVCASSGVIHILRVNLHVSGKDNHSRETVQEFARLELGGDIFSSPVMIGGWVFVGCRDDYVHCFVVRTSNNFVDE